MKQLLCLIVLSVFTSVTFSQTEYPDVFLTDRYKGIIFGVANNPFCRGNAFDPKRTEIDEAENYIKGSVDSLTRAFNDSSKLLINIEEKYDNYKRQYFGCILSSNTKILRITFDYVSDLSKINWNFIEVMLFDDGGDNHWSIEFDLNKKKIISFSVNSIGG